MVEDWCAEHCYEMKRQGSEALVTVVSSDVDRDDQLSLLELLRPRILLYEGLLLYDGYNRQEGVERGVMIYPAEREFYPIPTHLRSWISGKKAYLVGYGYRFTELEAIGRRLAQELPEGFSAEDIQHFPMEHPAVVERRQASLIDKLRTALDKTKRPIYAHVPAELVNGKLHKTLGECNIGYRCIS